MFIEIKGVGFINKGAELMLHAILQEVGERVPQAKFVLAPGPKSPYEKRAHLGLYQKIWFSKYGILLGVYFGKHLPKTLREYYGLITHQEIDSIFDASGFSYGDQWGPAACIAMAKSIKEWKKFNTKIILMPQAMGPFSSKKIRKAFAYVLEKADLVFPRDEASFKYATDLVGEQEYILQAPDFTNLVEGILPETFKQKENMFCIIPNYRMIVKTSANDKEGYLRFLLLCIQHLLKKGNHPFILVHGGENDFLLGQEVCKRCKQELPIVFEMDPLKIKGIIGACSGVISSRYHGLISALSQGVPALTTSWSHKYEMLLAEYGFPEGCVKLDASATDIQEKIDQISEAEQIIQLKEKITKAANIQKQKTKKMWVKVFECIGV